ncbi:MAG: DUF3592 domain-containing protein [Nitrospinae bacterium]|nr:DUF3592 domain-containing protein [Nitrospinota bacterium]
MKTKSKRKPKIKLPADQRPAPAQKPMAPKTGAKEARQDIKKKKGLPVFFIVLALVGVGLILFGFRQVMIAAMPVGLPEVEAVVTNSDVVETGGSFSPRVAYTYMMNGTGLRSEALLPDGEKLTYKTREKAEAKARKYTVGAKVKAFYDPLNQNGVFLEKPLAVTAEYFIFAGVILTLISMGGILAAVILHMGKSK